MTGVLDGVRVLDFGRYIAGPFCATLLAEFGADVIRVEKVRGSEDRFVQPVSEGGPGAAFLQLARNKRGMTLNPRTSGGAEIVRRLAATADVVVANLPPPTLAAMGIDHESLKACRRDIILTTASGFGHRGPMRNRVGFDGIGQAMNGAMYLSGRPEEPMRAFLPYVDFGTALYSAFGTMAALMHREKTGEGQVVSASLLGSALSFNHPAVIEQALRAPNREATGNRGQTSAPTDAFQTRDGWILVQTVGNPLYERWARLMGEERWLADPRFASDEGRGDHRDIICARMAEWTGERTTAECVAALDEARVPSAPVLTPQDILEHDHIRAMGLMAPVAFPGVADPAPLLRLPLDLSASPGAIRRRAPTLGEHTDEILGELGYAAGEIAALRADGAI